jgi:hypothetical protein
MHLFTLLKVRYAAGNAPRRSGDRAVLHQFAPGQRYQPPED